MMLGSQIGMSLGFRIQTPAALRPGVVIVSLHTDSNQSQITTVIWLNGQVSSQLRDYASTILLKGVEVSLHEGWKRYPDSLYE